MDLISNLHPMSLLGTSYAYCIVYITSICYFKYTLIKVIKYLEAINMLKAIDSNDLMTINGGELDGIRTRDMVVGAVAAVVGTVSSVAGAAIAVVYTAAYVVSNTPYERDVVRGGVKYHVSYDGKSGL